MNLHSIDNYDLPTIRDYLQHQHGWEWQITEDQQTLAFRVDRHSAWIEMARADVESYALEAGIWRSSSRRLRA